MQTQHYTIKEDDTGFYINRMGFVKGEGFARRETIYSELTEKEAIEIAEFLTKHIDKEVYR